MPRWISALVAIFAVGALLAGAVTGGAGAAPAKKSPAAQRSHTPSKAPKASKAKAQPTKVQSTSDDGKPSVSHVCEPGDELGLGEPDTYGGDGAPAPPTRCD